MYSNPNNRFHGVHTERIIRVSDHPPLITGAEVAANEANKEHVGLEVFSADRLNRRHLLKVVEAMPVMRARKDKRRRPNSVTKAVFKTYRKLKLR